MAGFKVCLTEKEQRIVDEQRRTQTHQPTRRKMEVLWLVHHGMTREKTAEMVGVSLSTVNRYVKAYREGGLEGLQRWNKKGRPGELEPYRETLAESFRERPVATVAEASKRIKDLTGIQRGPTQTRMFLKSLGLEWQRVGTVPVPPKKVSRSMWGSRSGF